MNGWWRHLWIRRGLYSSLAGVLAIAGLVGCGGEQRSGAVPADSNRSSLDTSAAAAPDTLASARQDSATQPDTTKAAPSTSQRDTARQVAGTPAPRKPPTPRPAAPVRPAQRDSTTADTSQKTASAQPTGGDTSTAAAQPSEPTATAPTQTNQANAPLRDPYHRAPLDTVSQQVYDGWKQFNLNCARCHGEDVQGTTIAPHLVTSLKPDGPINTKELFVQTVCAGRPAKGMPAWCPLGLEMDKIEKIYSYVKGRSDAKLGQGRPALKPGA